MQYSEWSDVIELRAKCLNRQARPLGAATEAWGSNY